MKISLKQLQNSYRALASICAQKPPSVKLGYKLGRIFKCAEAEFESLNEKHIEMLRACGAVSVGRGLEVPDDRQEEWRRVYQPQLDDLLTVEVEIWGDPIKLSDIDGQLTLSGVEFAALDWLIVDDGEGATADGKPATKPDIAAVAAAV